jgi:protein-disulfide isomerase
MKAVRFCAPEILLLAMVACVACDAYPPPPGRKADPGPVAIPGADNLELFMVPLGDAPARGNPEARVTIVMFSEFQCPYCARVQVTIEQIRKTYGDDVRFVWRHLPLPFHDRAVPAALAAEAAREQGRFWEMHEQLFAHQQALAPEDLEGQARAVGLDLGRFRASMAGEGARARIDRDRRLGEALGVRGTPSFFINGRRLVGAQPFASFQAVIEAELARAAEKLKAGVPRSRLYAALTDGGLEKISAATAAAEAPAGKGCHGGTCAGATAANAEDSSTVFKVDPGQSPARGPAAAAVTVVLFSDFECPFCKKIEPTLEALERDYPGKVRVVWKNFPLEMHRSARLAAAAAMAAHAQGKFWAMHDRLLANQSALERAALEGYARDLGLEPARFQAALGGADALVEADLKQAASLGVTGTPTVFVNGHRVTGAYPLATFKKLVDEELARLAGRAAAPAKGG